MIQTKKIEEKLQSEVKPLYIAMSSIVFICVIIQAFCGPAPREPFQAKDSTIGVQTMEVKAKAEEKQEQPKEETTTPEPAKQEVVVNSELELKSTSNLDQEKDKSQIVGRITQFFKENKSPLTEKEAETFYNLGKKYKIHPYAVVAVAFADSSLGKNLTTSYNLGNVGNTDSCPTCQAYSSWSQGIEAIFKTLTNKYLGKATRLCHLSRGGWKFCPEGKKINNGKFYASSTSNWDRNANYAASWLLNQEFNRDFNYKNF